MMHDPVPLYREVAQLLQRNPRITVLTGAGVSAASGIPTFRDAQGLWEGVRPEEVATPGAFARDPEFVWRFYDQRRQQLLACRPNRGHQVLAAWSRRYSGFSLITQNVDGLHEAAGTEGVTRFHGSLWEVGCWEECPESPWRWRDETVPFAEIPPSCPHCGGMLRPGVVWFGEGIEPVVVEQADAATSCDLFFTIGTSAVVFPAADLIFQAKRHGAFVVEINPRKTPASGRIDLFLQGNSENVLDRIEALL